MPKKGALKYRELIKRLKTFGVKVYPDRGKGSEIILYLPVEPGSKKGPQYPIKYHGNNTEYHFRVVDALLRHLSIDPKDFW